MILSIFKLDFLTGSHVIEFRHISFYSKVKQNAKRGPDSDLLGKVVFFIVIFTRDRLWQPKAIARVFYICFGVV